MIFFPCFPFIFFNMRLWWVFEVQIWLQEFNPSQLWWTQLFWPMVSLFLTHSWKGKKKGKMGKTAKKKEKCCVEVLEPSETLPSIGFTKQKHTGNGI